MIGLWVSSYIKGPRIRDSATLDLYEGRFQTPEHLLERRFGVQGQGQLGFETCGFKMRTLPNLTARGSGRVHVGWL